MTNEYTTDDFPGDKPFPSEVWAEPTFIDQPIQPQNAITRISDKIDPNRTKAISASPEGGLSFSDYGQVIEFAKMMAETGWALPPHLRKSQTGCLAICTRAGWWRLDPYFVAEHSYLMGKTGYERLAFDAAIFQAVVNARAPIKHRLKHRFIGEGLAMKCVVWSTFVGDHEPTEHESPMLGERMPPKNDKGQVRGSPLWTTKPRVQLAYDTMRDWARLYCQDVLGGIYDKDELLEQDVEILTAQRADPGPTSPNLIGRLSGRISEEGFGDDNVANGVNGTDGHKPPPKSRKAPQSPMEARGEVVQEGATPQPTETETAPSPQEKAPPAKPRRDWSARPPLNAGEYGQYLTEWLATSNAPSDIMERFKSERKLRNGAGMVGADTAECKRWVDERISTL